MAAARCSFCGQKAVEGNRLVSGRAAAICDQCVILCQEVLAGRRTPAQARELSERARDLLDGARREMSALRFGGAMERLQDAETTLSDLLALLGPTR